jgi:hypothetical protein
MSTTTTAATTKTTSGTEPLTKRLLSDVDRTRLSSQPTRSFALTVSKTKSRADFLDLATGVVVEVSLLFKIAMFY